MSEESIHPFIAFLSRLKESDDRAALAHLRRGLGKEPGTEPKVFPYVVPWIKDDMLASERKVYFIAASLFALHPANSESGNMGTAFRQIGLASGDSGSIERRFVHLLNSHPDDLPSRLRHAIGMAKSKNVPVNYSRLLRDLRYWDSDSRKVQQRWAEEFWGSTSGDNQSNDNDE